jgi:hypothetical protein
MEAAMRTIKTLVAVTLSLSTTLALGGCGAPEETGDDTVEVSSLNCGAPNLEVITVGRENRFGLDGQQVALDPGIPTDRICNNRLKNAACKSTCQIARAQAIATGVKGFQDTDPVRLRQMGQLADTFNAALGNRTNFRALGADSLSAGPQAAQCNAKVLQVVVQGKEHRFGFDGRQVALNPQIPMDNICQPLAGSCKAVCTAAEQAAVATGVKGFSGADNAVQLRQMGVLADTFNAAMGHTSNFANAPIFLN